jgi:hypothetical protein
LQRHSTVRARSTELLTVAAAAALLTLAIAAPVLRAPSERLFGRALVGRHHDPFTVMEQFRRPITIAVYSQPVTDIPGALLARVVGPVAAYNWLVLLSFPLSAAGAYLLARHLTLQPWPAAAAALAYAFSPFHLAHAAYHPHVAQTQWLPLYLLALWRCLDTASMLNTGLLAATAIAVTLSNFYGGLIAAVITPVAVAPYWLLTRKRALHPARNLGITAGCLAALGACGAGYALYAAGPVVANPTAFAFPRADLFRYSARWWGYFVPPVSNPFLGRLGERVWASAGVQEGLLEQQVSLGWGVAGLSLVASWFWLMRRRDAGRPATLRYVPVLVAIACVALLCSLSPERTIGVFRFVRPSALLYDVLPMFRSYARFGVVVELMAVLLAAIGVDSLLRTGTRRGRVASVVLASMIVGEYAVAPSAMWRDVLPTAAHRWMMRQAEPARALDCTPPDQESASVLWLTAGRIVLLDAETPDCAEPRLPEKLAATGYTHLIVRPGGAAPGWPGGVAPDGLTAAARFADAQVFAVSSAVPAIYTAALTGWSPREYDAVRSWRWMGAAGEWRIVNTVGGPCSALLDVEIAAFHHSRALEVRLDGQLLQTVVVEPARRVYRLGPMLLAPGEHSLGFRPSAPASSPSQLSHSNDTRPLSFAFGTWGWTTAGDGR